MATLKNIILITGGKSSALEKIRNKLTIKANGGIGFELASQLLSDASKHVLLGSRSAAKGEAAVKDLQSRRKPGTVELLQLDVTSSESITAAAKTVESKHNRYASLDLVMAVSDVLTNVTRLDALVNNAAIGIPPGSPAQQMAQAFQTNATGPMLMVDAFAPLLKRSSGKPRIVSVTSGAGSIAKRLDPTSSAANLKAVPYRASKAAMNMITATQVVEYGADGFKIFSFCPGFTVSNLGPQNKMESGAKPTSEGAAPIVQILNGERDAEHGKFLHATGQYPW